MARNSLIHIIAITLLSFSMQISAMGHSPTPVSLQLKYTHQFQFAGYYAAKEMGYYKDEGLEVEFREWSPEFRVIDHVIKGDADFGIGDPTLLPEFVNGQPIVVLAALFQESPLALFSKQESGIFLPSDFIGKRVMYNTNGVGGADIGAMLATQNVDSSQFIHLKHNHDYQGLIDGDVDVISGYLTDSPYFYKSQHTVVNILKPQSYGVNFYGDILFTSQDMLKHNPETVEKFKRASLKGWHYAVNHIDEINNLIIKQYNPTLDRDKLTFEAQETIKLMNYPIVEVGHMHQQRWDHIADIFQQQGMINKEVDFARFIYQPTAISYLYLVFALSAFVFLLIIWILRNYFHQRALVENLTRLNIAFNTADQGWFDINAQTEEIAVSDEYARLLGFEPSEFHTNIQEWHKNIHPDDIKRVLALLEEGYATGDVCETEYRRKTKDGSWLWLHVVGQVIEWDDKNNPVRAVGVQTDITKRKQTELELGKSEERLLLSQSAGGIGTWEYDFTTDQSICSDVVLQELGFPLTADKSTWDDVFAAIYPEDRDKVNSVINLHISEGTKLDVEYRIIDVDGKTRWMRTIGEAVFDVDNKPIKLRGTVQDISARKISDQALRILAETGSDNKHNIFELIVQQLALSQGTRYALIAEVDKHNPERVNTLAVWANNGFIDNFSYTLAGTPCNNVIQQEACFYPSNIQNLFPDDPLLVDMHAEGYLGLPLTNNQGEVMGLIAVLDDKPMTNHEQVITIMRSLSSRASIELERAESLQKLNLSSRVFSDTHEGITITDSQKFIIDVNPAFCEITGYSRQDVIGQNPRILSSGKQSPQFYADMWKEINEVGHWQGEVWNRKKTGEIYAELLTISSLSDDDDKITHYVGVFSDITQSKKQQEELSLMAHYDVLTGLPNRALFTDRFHQSIAHSKRTKRQFAVCFIDLDEFKPVNDDYGHEIGDKLLIEVAERITNSIRNEDTVSRQGGDEFALLLNDIESFEQCEQTIQRIHHTLAQPYIIDGYPHKITASSGFTLYPSDEGDIDTLLRHADHAMYQAKQEGRNRYHLFDPKHDHETIQKHHLLAEIEHALINNEFSLYYQPKVNMSSGNIFGAEALIRWIHPEKGLIPPLDFLPFIDGTELEIKIGDWVINQALIQLDNWHQQGIKLEVSVNISSNHLQSDSFIDKLTLALEHHPTLYSKNLQLEILESSALGDLQSVSHIIKTCQETLGVTVALDDFGTGYSSLTHLRSLSANIIKIDQSFVRDMLDDPDDYTIIDGIIGLSNAFSREVIAEGVETTNHGLMLMMMGCEEAQGYGISKPLPEDDFSAWFNSYIPNQEWLIFSQKYRSRKENKIKLFRLITEHWKQQFVSNILASAEDIVQWSIMNQKHCPCGSWITRERQEQLFDQQGLKRLEKAHDEVHFIAYAIQSKYLEGDIQAARAVLTDLQSAFEQMSNAVGQCD